MAPQDLDKEKRLPQTNETWQCGLRKMPSWVDEPGSDGPFRPFIGLVAAQDSETILAQNMWAEAATPDEVLQLLVQAMTQPLFPLIPPSRPGRIHFNDDEIANQLRGRLGDLGIQVRSFPTLPLIDSIINQLGDHLADQGYQVDFPSLVEIPGIEENMLREYYAAAAHYARQKPWKWLDDAQPIAVRYPAGGPERYAVIMGQGQETYGLATYETLESLALTYSGAPAEVAAQYGSMLSMLLEVEENLPIADLDAIEYHRWPVASPQSYPIALKYSEYDEIDPPTIEEIIFLSACMRVLPGFIQKHLVIRKGLRQSAEHTFTLPEKIYQGQQISFSFPVDMEAVDPSLMADAALNVLNELTEMLDAGIISPEDLNIQPEDMERLYLIDFISEWEIEEDQIPLAMDVGLFMLIFGRKLALEEFLADETVDNHMDNAWHIGRMLLEEKKIETFSPAELFINKPMLIKEFKIQVSDAKSRITSYERTWRKLGRYALLITPDEYNAKRLLSDQS